MELKVGDYVTRNSYNNDLVFLIVNIEEHQVFLKGVNVRLYADSAIEDLKIYQSEDTEEEEFLNRIKPINNLDRSDYFYLPGKILHIDGDEDYLKRCLDYYKEASIWAVGVKEQEENVPIKIEELLNKYRPNIVVITGHDAYYQKKGDSSDLNSYKNSSNFVESVKNARKYEKNHDKLIIIAGACQSYYDELIKAGANFASSPKRINIHALDPAVIATKMSLSEVADNIDIKSILEKTKYGKDGIGGIKTKGTMYIGYPR